MPPPPAGPPVPVFTLGFNLILKSPVPLEYWFLVLLPRSSFALLTCGFTSLIIGSGGGAVGVGGNGGGGGDNEDQAGGQTGGVGGDNEQAPGNGPDDDSQGGDAGTNGAAIRESSGVSFTFGTGDLDNGTIEPSSFTNAANAQQGVA